MKAIRALFLVLFGFLFTSVSPLIGIPVITSLSENSNAAGVSGDQIVVHGTGFGVAPVVHFDSVEANVVSSSPTQITVEVPKGVVSTVAITVTVGGEASEINAASYFAYTGDWTAYFTSTTNTLFSVDIGTHSVVDTVHTTFGLLGPIAITPDGSRAYFNGLDNLGTRSWTAKLNLLTRAVNYIVGPIEGTPGGVAITPDGKSVYTVLGNSVSPITVAGNAVGAPLTIPNAPFGIAITTNGTTAYVANQGAAQVTPITLGSNPVVETPINTGLVGNYWAVMNTTGQTGYFTRPIDGNVTSLQLGNGSLNPSIQIPFGVHPLFMAVNPGGHEAYVVGNDVSGTEGFLFRIVDLVGEPQLLRLLGGETLPPLRQVAITPSSTELYICLPESDQVLHYNILTGNHSFISVPSANHFVAITPDPAPIALFNATPGAPATATTFDASDSVSPVGDIRRYDWDFGDGNTDPDGGDAPSHTYATAGTYLVTLTVTNTAFTSIHPAFTGQTLIRNGGPSARASMIITVGAPLPTITGISPPGGPVAGGTDVVITGTNFSNDTLSVTFNGTPASYAKAVSPTKIVVTTPAGTAGAQPVIVNTVAGASNTSTYTYLGSPPPQPTVTNVSPDVGPIEGDQRVVITGTNFTANSQVFFGLNQPVDPSDIDFESPEMLIVQTPPYASGPFEVEVLVSSDGGGTSLVSAGSQYTYQSEPDVPPHVNEIYPNEGPATGGSRIIINGDNFFGDVTVYFDDVPATDVVVVDPWLITAVAPAGSGTVQVTVSTGAGDSDTQVFFAYLLTPPAAPVIQSISPPSGVETGFIRVKIKGVNFIVDGNTPTVYFGGVPSDDVDALSGEILIVETPEGKGTVPVQVTTLGGTSTQNFSFTYTEPLPPTVTGVLPNRGPVDGDQTITVTGTHFYDIEDVFMGGQGVNYFINSPENLTVFTRSAAAGPVDITVVTRHGTSPVTPNGQYTYLENPPSVPEIDSITPDHGSYEGNTLVTITGEHFLVGSGDARVYFGDTPALSVQVISDDTIEVRSPPGFGSENVYVSTIGGTSQEEHEFHYVLPGSPVVTSVTPNEGPVTGGQRITVKGENFKNVTEVYFPESEAVSFTVISDKIITAVSPATQGPIDGFVEVVTESGSSPFNVGSAYGYIIPGPKPQVLTISPTSGPADGGTEVTITGIDLIGGPPIENNTVYFGDQPAIGVRAISATELRAISPPVETAFGKEEVERDVVVSVSTVFGTSEEAVSFTYQFAAPTVTKISPNEGPEEGGSEVVITGTGFFGVEAIYFGNAQVEEEDYNVDSNTQITVLTPPGIGVVNVLVMTEYGTSPVSPNGKYTYLAETPPAPRVTSVTPNVGPAAGGTVVVIGGENFVFGETGVLFGQIPAKNIRVISENRLEVTSPQGSGTVHIRVTTPGGSSAISFADQFTYRLPPAPIVTSVSPNEGPQKGGSTVTITGRNFNAVVSVAFGPYLATNVTRISDAVITADTPPGEGTVQVVVKTETGSSPKSSESTFTYLRAPMSVPTVTGVSPNSGPASGGTRVTVTGTHFVSGNTDVYFGDIPGENVVVVSATTLKVTTPVSPTGVVNVTVTTPGGTSAISPRDKFTFIQVLYPPRKAQGVQLENKFAAQTDVINRITWQAPAQGTPPMAYKIYKDAALTKLLGTVSANSKKPYSFTQHNRRKDKVYTYYIVSIDGKGHQSKPAVVTIK